jgi:hypothetical protein
VERLRFEREHPEQAAKPAAQGEQIEPLQALQAGPYNKILMPLAAALAALQKPTGPVLTKALTVDEAAEARGLSRATILRMIHDGELAAIRDTPIRRAGEKAARPGSSWRIFPEDLAAVRGTVQRCVPEESAVPRLVPAAQASQAS